MTQTTPNFFTHDHTWLALGLTTAGIHLALPYFQRIYTPDDLTRPDGSKITMDQATKERNLGKIHFFHDHTKELAECRQAFFEAQRDVRAGKVPEGLDYIKPADVCKLAAVFQANRQAIFEATKMSRPSIATRRPDGSFVVIGADA